MLKSLAVAVLCATGAAAISAEPPATPENVAEGNAKQRSFREKFWPTLSAQGWTFITYSNWPSPSDAPLADWFFQTVKDRGPNIRSAWVLEVYYEPPFVFEPEIPAFPSYQSEKALVWVNCAEGSSQVRVWHRYKNTFGTDVTVTGTIYPPAIDLPTSAPAELKEQQPNSLGEAIVRAVCAAPMSSPAGK